ncbi:MAG TPA: pilus assembly protein PilM, partial [Thermosynechococcus sp. M55_K2018_012]|nr:pilus assembly protein PilM [Thermosynechococcus sp. M55_K2018_012]
MLGNLFAKPKQGLGIELTPERVNIVQLQRQKQGLKMTAMASVPLSEGAIEEGRIIDTTAVAD